MYISVNTNAMNFFYLVVISGLLAGCSPNISATDNYKQKTRAHSSIAILPFDITLNLTKGQQQVINEADQAALSQSLSLDLQQKFYVMLLRYAQRHRIAVQVQPIEETLQRLSTNNIRFNDLHQPDKHFIIKALQVDAVLEPHMIISQKGVAFSGLVPLPNGYAQVNVRNLYIAFGVSVKDQSTDTAFWNYRNEQWYQAANKIKKDKNKAANDFLEPLFLNIEDILKACIVKLPYR